MVKKIAVFGGTGMTGQSVVEYALSQGEPKKNMGLINIVQFPSLLIMCHLLSLNAKPHSTETKQEKKITAICAYVHILLVIASST